jgi:hypothetical protein
VEAAQKEIARQGLLVKRIFNVVVPEDVVLVNHGTLLVIQPFAEEMVIHRMLFRLHGVAILLLRHVHHRPVYGLPGALQLIKCALMSNSPRKDILLRMHPAEEQRAQVLAPVQIQVQKANAALPIFQNAVISIIPVIHHNVFAHIILHLYLWQWILYPVSVILIAVLQ